MKNANLVFKYINKYKKRSFAIVFSIVLSIALIIGIGVLSDSAKQAEINKTKLEQGSYHVQYRYLDKEKIEIIKNNENIEHIGIASYYDTYETHDGSKLFLMNTDEEYFNLDSLNTKDTLIKDGKFPTKKGEIALEQWVIDYLQINGELGDKITLDLKDTSKKETFTLVGILEDRLSQQMTLTAQAFLALDNSINNKDTTASISFKSGVDIESNIKNIATKANIKNEDIRKNSHLLDKINGSENIEYRVVGISIGIFIVTFLVIYGIFSISIIQRISEYGILRAIGCSSKRIFSIILQELLYLSILGIPIGLLVGLIGAKLLSTVSGGLFTEGVVEINKLTISLDIVILSIVVILLDILFIALFTYINIKKISPMDAIKKNLTSNKSIKKTPISRNYFNKILSFSNLISLRNILRNKKTFLMIVLSMSIGGILFILSDFYTDLSDNQSKKLAEINGFDSDYKINMVPGTSKDSGISDEDLNNIKSLDGVKGVTASKVIYSRMMLSEWNIAQPLYFDNINNTPYAKDLMNGILVENEKSSSEEDKYILKNTMYGYDDDLLKKLDKYVVKGKLDLDEMRNEDIAIVRIPHPYNTENKAPYVADIKVGDKIKVAFKTSGTNSEESWRVNYNDDTYTYKEFTVGAIVDELIDYDNYYTVRNSVDVVIHSNKFGDATGFKNYRAISINKEDGINHKMLNDKIHKITDKTTGSVVRDLTEEVDSHNTLGKNKLIFMYSIILILFVITLFNITNNISYTITSRVNEFGMMRAIGLNEIMLRKMFIFEGLVYGVISSIFSVCGGLIGQVVMFRYISPQLISPKFIVKYEDYIFIVLMNIFISVLTTYISSRKIKKLSVVDSITLID